MKGTAGQRTDHMKISSLMDVVPDFCVLAHVSYKIAKQIIPETTYKKTLGISKLPCSSMHNSLYI